jgi:hypothetical protein
LGEPLRSLAKVEIRGTTGPQAADLAHMRAVRKHLETALQLAKGMSRQEFEKRFGPGQKDNFEPESDSQFTVQPSWTYQVANGKVHVSFDDGSKVDHPSGYTDQRPPLEPSPDTGCRAQVLARAERDLLLAFLTKRFSDSSVVEKKPLRVFLEKTAIDLQWTDKERKQMLGD